ncbi:MULTISPECIES: glycoside hydrolase family 127 protein [unclassified Niallia]|uniref:glycoside hydrolase family 127 protein n=1 Tax=unclassified Niallia TaxID=2837522 RepID=UPI001ED9CF9D|nr:MULTISPECIES: glycoside hydrolase family 127 protein [unclassified Niallia]MDL0434482.1 glycoside hydrolase family 127 protein [Niallia sp. SS-2023]UPO88546.1 glycoside hydrolase family 127 protein [Niallia sp. Man26]
MTVEAFHLRQVRITDGPFKHAMELNRDYLLQLKPDKLLSRYRQYAGLEPKADHYKGWEEQGISGHTLGHYISACSMMAAATGDSRFNERTAYIIDELALCQQADGTGLICGIPRGKGIFQEVKEGKIYSQGFDLNGGWVPLYTMHKVFAGLRDAYIYTDNEKALQVEIKLGLWLEDMVRGLSEEQMDELLKCEFGGMAEVLADLAVHTSDDRFFALSERFYHKEVLSPLADRRDALAGRHANTQIPKVVAAARQYEISGNEMYKEISEFFWDTVVHEHSYVIGGNSLNEHFGEAGKLNDRLGENTCETCNSYNMLKLTKHLFKWKPTAEEGDYYERALYNHILASQNPHDGSVCYFVSLDMGGHKKYNSKFDSFTCCVGSGMENHASHGNAIYFHDENKLYVNQYIPSRLDWDNLGVIVEQKTEYPQNGRIRIELSCQEEKAFSLYLRYPYWAVSGMEISINGEQYQHDNQPASLIEIERVWQEGDVLDIHIPMTLRKEAILDNPDRVAFLHGPIVLAGDLGEISDAQVTKDLLFTPVLVTDDDPIHAIVATADAEYRLDGIGNPRDVKLLPFYLLHDRSATVYWDVFTKDKWQEAEKAYKEALQKEQALQEKTLDFVQPGEMQPERDHQFEGEHVGIGTVSNRKYRDTWPNGHFRFNLTVLPNENNSLIAAYTKNEWNSMKEFDVLADDRKLADGKIEWEEMSQFVYVKYEIPSVATDRISITFRAHPDKRVPKVFELRTIKG